MVLRKAALIFSLAAASLCGVLLAAPLSVEPTSYVTHGDYAIFPSSSPIYETPFPEPPSTTAGCGEPPSQTNCYKCPDCYNGQWMCYVIDCGPVTCVDPVYSPGECCPRCPNGPNCKINNEIVGFGQSVTLDDGQVCFCLSDVSWEAPEAKCLVTMPPLPGAPTPEPWSPPSSEPPCEADTQLIPGEPIGEYPPQTWPEQPTPPQPLPQEPTPPESTTLEPLPTPEEPTPPETTTTATTTTPRKKPKVTAKKTPAPPKKKTLAPPKKKTNTAPPKKTPKTPKTTAPKKTAATTPKRSPTTTPKKTKITPKLALATTRAPPKVKG